MLIIIGKGGSGKDTVKDILVNDYGFHGLVTYTTRPMRIGEIQDITYHYISNKEFLRRIEEGFFAEWKKYSVNGNTWYYGTGKEDIENADENTVAVLTPDGVRDLKKQNIQAVVVYLRVGFLTIMNRLQARNDINDKVIDRVRRDEHDFSAAELLADKVVYNNNDRNIEDVVETIVSQYREAVAK